mmetsp:Transcript_48044/g.134134  ORF Transcript_48044/g.134134 Transcript_48044/m.134134 type:complete len:366 (+) Transcript_48044:1077-2174(+)
MLLGPTPGEQEVDEREDYNRRQAVQEAHSARHPFAKRAQARDVLEDDIVAPAEVQGLEPESHRQGVAHAERDRVEAARTCNRSALGKAPVSRRLRVARLLAAEVHRAEGQLTDRVGVAWWLEVARSAREDDERAVRALQQLAKGQVVAALEIVHLQAPFVILVQDSAQLVVQRGQDNGQEQAGRDEGLPNALVKCEMALRVLGDRAEDGDLDEAQHGPEQEGRADDRGQAEEHRGAQERDQERRAHERRDHGEGEDRNQIAADERHAPHDTLRHRAPLEKRHVDIHVLAGGVHHGVGVVVKQRPGKPWVAVVVIQAARLSQCDLGHVPLAMHHPVLRAVRVDLDRRDQEDEREHEQHAPGKAFQQ